MKAVFLMLALLVVLEASGAGNKLVDAYLAWQHPVTGSDISPEQQAARSELVVRAVREAEERKQRTVKKPSLSEQAMIVRGLYGY